MVMLLLNFQMLIINSKIVRLALKDIAISVLFPVSPKDITILGPYHNKVMS